MGFSNVQLANLALSYCGISSYISSLTEESNEARVCTLHFDPTRDELLESFAWPFATKYASLALDEEFEDGDIEGLDWLFSYNLPIDCLAVRRIQTGDGPNESTPLPFAVGQDIDGRQLLYTNTENPSIEYTGEFDNPQFFSPTFAKAFAWSLAAEIAMPLSSSEGVRQRALDMARKTLQAAKASALGGTRPPVDPDSSFIQARA